MIIVKLWGGLGNQLFQYAFGYALAKKYNDEFFLDTSFYKKHQYSYVGYREYELCNLCCNPNIISDNPYLVKFLELFVVNRVLQKFTNTISFSAGKVHYVKEQKKTYMATVPYRPEKINYYDGYWQSGLYFEDYKNELKALFQPAFEIPQETQSFISTIDGAENSISVHIRKGDFKGKIGHALEDDYYIKAIEYVKNNIRNPEFFIFSDDISWVKNNIDFGKNPHFAENVNKHGAILDILCMAKCKHGIMSASTFSWWGNWLKDGIVIAPDGFYFNDKFGDSKWVRK